MRFALALALLVACGRDTPPNASSDALWAFAPANARGGIVISGRGLRMIESGYTTLRTLVETVPDLAALKDRLTEAMAPFGPAITLADFGFAADKGAALFMMKDGMVAILPLVDRDKFLAKVHGTKGEVATSSSRRCTARRARSTRSKPRHARW
jgi:hypothetical protein